LASFPQDVKVTTTGVFCKEEGTSSLGVVGELSVEKEKKRKELQQTPQK